MRESVNAAIIREGNILVVRKGESWLLPGGKREKGESDLECLSRELYEELSGAIFEDYVFYGTFVGKTHIGEDFKTTVYKVGLTSGQTIIPSAEIAEAKWIESPEGYAFSDMNLRVFDSLRKDGYLRF